MVRLVETVCDGQLRVEKRSMMFATISRARSCLIGLHCCPLQVCRNPGITGSYWYSTCICHKKMLRKKSNTSGR
jgi:hypothetical protein